MPKKQINKVINSVGAFFDVLSHPDRIRLIGLLKNKEMDVNEIHEALEISQSRTSQHLKLLKFNSIVVERKEGKHVYYKLKNKNITKVMQTALQFQLLTYSAEPETIQLISDLLITWHI
ncbi:MAG: metalloregulator ArsR/SmtB family transcription factor [Candidatus Gastranaerophilales bacterium]|nr:metalloregulator ArsR/SmtB family transcription factor [Candidatus Gastranaerophilales bacterium]